MTRVSLTTSTNYEVGSMEVDIIEVVGSNQLVFGDDSNDLIDASIGSEGGNRIYGGNGDDTFILGSGDSVFGDAGDDKFFVLSGGDNILTGGAGADQFWIASAEIPDSANIITDFTIGDALGIAGLGIGLDDLSIIGQDNNTLIAVNGSDLAILEGVDSTSLNVDANGNSITVTIKDQRQKVPFVSFSTTPTIINEAEGTELVMNFSVEGEIPEGGITVNLEGNTAGIMQQFTAAQTRFNPDGTLFYRFDNSLVANNVVGGVLDRFSLDANPDSPGFLSNFSFTITEATASITIPVLNDIIEEADATYTYTLVDGEGYTVNPEANSGTFTVTDGVPGGVGPTVGVTATPEILYESEATVLTLTFTTQGEIPPEGVVVLLEGPPRAIAEFDVNATNPRLPEDQTVVIGPVVAGGSIVGTNETAGGLFFRIFEPTATIQVPVYQDNVTEGTEIFTFNLRNGELYEVDANASSITVTIEDEAVVVGEPIVRFSTNENGEVITFAYDLTAVGDVKASLDQEALDMTDAAFDNLVGFYEVIDQNGSIDVDGDGIADFNPGDVGYARAALENAIDGIAIRLGGNPNNDTTAATFGDVIIQGGKSYAPFAIANAGDLSVEDFLEINPNNNAAIRVDDQVAYFAFGAANPDGANHLKSWGNGIFGFEDLPANLGVSDNDFNDAVFKFNFTV